MARHADDSDLPNGRPAADILAEHGRVSGTCPPHTDPSMRSLPTSIRRRIAADKNAHMRVPPPRPK